MKSRKISELLFQIFFHLLSLFSAGIIFLVLIGTLKMNDKNFKCKASRLSPRVAISCASAYFAYSAAISLEKQGTNHRLRLYGETFPPG